ncbi:prephenate dehydrogenase/arogenate dehydrogenase family protein [candidate division KSB3 bacterium]|uniref:Prephenate dehydrogenase/arogenate dehydrogenase family protein n=1 Tax=candidate division KSB3 bacterium TaxID=2044937 RepID=A0A9D5Q5D3_9BACT|nr:prephenate dehydrogenase/arogenate dehydrogenase family protein [candidate division KSB3 bacterium]
MKIAVLGAGHMGRWFARELLTEGHEIAVFDVDPDTTHDLPSAQILSALPELEAFAPELLLNAVSIRRTIEAFQASVPYLPDHCVLVDVTSVKGDLPKFYQQGNFRYASLHPMFGPTFANVDNLREENTILITESDPNAKEFFRAFFQKRGLNIFEFSFKAHDQMTAYSLSLPFASTLVFAACMKNTTVPGTTFKRHLTIAKGLLSEDDHLLAEILFNQYSLEQLEKVTARLEFLKHVIRDRDYEEAQRFFQRLRENITP